MSLMGKCCCGGGCNGACLAVEPNTNSCDPTLPTSAYINSLPAFITVEIDLTWDGTPYTFSFVMKKFTLICDPDLYPDLLPLCEYKMYCGDVAACDAWPHTIAGQVLLGDKGGCNTVDCDYPCSPNFSYNPTNAPSDYKAIITCGVNNFGAPESDESCPCVYPDAGCSWVGVFNIEMHAAKNCDLTRFLNSGTVSIAKDTGFSFDPTAHKRQYAFNCRTSIDVLCDYWTYSTTTNDYCAPAFLIDTTFGYDQCGGSAWADGNYGGYAYYTFGNSGCNYTCYSQLVSSYPLTKISLTTPPEPPFYNGIFDAFGSVNFDGNLSTVTYRPCCGVVTPTGGHAIAWEVTRFEVV